MDAFITKFLNSSITQGVDSKGVRRHQTEEQTSNDSESDSSSITGMESRIPFSNIETRQTREQRTKQYLIKQWLRMDVKEQDFHSSAALNAVLYRFVLFVLLPLLNLEHEGIYNSELYVTAGTNKGANTAASSMGVGAGAYIGAADTDNVCISGAAEVPAITAYTNAAFVPPAGLLLSPYVSNLMLKCRVDTLLTQLAASVLCQPHISTLLSTFLRPVGSSSSDLNAVASASGDSQLQIAVGTDSQDSYDIRDISAVEEDDHEDLLSGWFLSNNERVLLELSFHLMDLQLQTHSTSNSNSKDNGGSKIIEEAYIKRVDSRRVGLVLQCLRHRWGISAGSSSSASSSSSTSTWTSFNRTAGTIAVIKEYLDPCLVAFTKDLLCLSCDSLSSDMTDAIKCCVNGVCSDILALKRSGANITVGTGSDSGSHRGGAGAVSAGSVVGGVGHASYSLGAVRGHIFSAVKPCCAVDRLLVRAVGDYFQWCRSNADELIKQCQIGMILECGCNGINSSINATAVSIDNETVNHNVSIRTVRQWLKNEVYYSYAHLMEVYRHKYQRYLSYMLLPPILLCIYSGGLYRHTTATAATCATADYGDGTCPSVVSSQYSSGTLIPPGLRRSGQYGWHDRILQQVSKDLNRERRVRLVVRQHRERNNADVDTTALKNNNNSDRGSSGSPKYNSSGGDSSDSGLIVIETTDILENNGVATTNTTDTGSSKATGTLSERLRRLLATKVRQLFLPCHGSTAQSESESSSSTEASSSSQQQEQEQQCRLSAPLSSLVELIVYYVLLGCSRSYTVGDGFFILNDLYGPEPELESTRAAGGNGVSAVPVFRACSGNSRSSGSGSSSGYQNEGTPCKSSSSSNGSSGGGGGGDDEISVFLSRNGVKVVISEQFDLIESPSGNRRAVLSRFSVVVTTLLIFNNNKIITTPGVPGSPGMVRISSASDITSAATPGATAAADTSSFDELYRTLRFNPDSCYHRYVSIKPLPI